MNFSRIDKRLTIEKLLEIDESITFDRKSAKIANDLPKLAKNIIGFANAEGGLIAIGIQDRKIEGISFLGNTKINDILQCGFDHCVPPVPVKSERILVIKDNDEEDELILLWIEPSLGVIHKTKRDSVYFRVGDETKKLDFEQRQNLEFTKGTRFFEDQFRKDWDWSHLDESALEQYRLALDFDGNYEDLLKARSFLVEKNGQLEINNAALLLFTKFPDGHIPNAKVRFFRYDGIKAEVGVNMNIIKSQIFDSPMVLLIKKVQTFIEIQLREFTSLDSKTGKFVSIPEYPPFAWLEGIVNAIIHRSYNIQGDDIKIKMYDDRLEIESPGKLPAVVSIQNIKDVRYSRNPKIARAMTELGWARELNEGVKRIYKDMAEYFLEEPTYIEGENSTTLILRNNYVMRSKRQNERISSMIGLLWEELNENEKTALNLVYNLERLKTKELAIRLDKGVHYARNLLNRLEDKGILEKKASSDRDPTTYYTMKK